MADRVLQLKTDRTGPLEKDTYGSNCVQLAADGASCTPSGCIR